jgi:hypothetical protein
MVVPPVAPNPVKDRPNEAEPMHVSDKVVVSEGATMFGTVLTV